MIRIDGFYLYATGHSIHPLTEIHDGALVSDIIFPCFIAQGRVETLLTRTVFNLRTSQQVGHSLLEQIRLYTNNPSRTEPLQPHEIYSLTSAAQEFEHVLAAEFGTMNIYLVVKKRGYDTFDLIENGVVLFPDDLILKVPDAIPDINEATKCIAFELPTAAGFHLHRANESVLHKYFDAVTKGADRPSGRNIGDYLKALQESKEGDKRVLSALKDLKDLHRNPLIHPEDSLESIDEAIALLGSVQSVVVHMLKAIPLSQESASSAAVTTVG